MGNRVKEESPVVTDFFKLAYSVWFLVVAPNTKIALPRDFFQWASTTFNQGTAAAHGSGAAHLREKSSAVSNTAHTWIPCGPAKGLGISGKAECD